MEDFERRTKFIDVLNSEEIQRMRTACKIARTILDTAAKWIAPGVCTDTLDQVVHEACIDHECYPSPLNYMGFPKSCCTSINEVICHGIPDRRPLQEGELINIDISIYKDGMHADLSETYMVGNQVSLEAYRLVEGTREALKDAIEQVRPGTMYRDLGKVIEARANQDRLGVVRTYCGHGIHKYFHCKPNVPHYAKNKAIGIMKPGHVFTIEPMLTLGEFREVHWPDHWTAVTKDGRFSAQFEHTLLVTETGYEILTLGQPQDTVMDGLPEKWKCRPTT
ncbi:Methionine aminopeptidase 1 [Coelomomyces lativittatus]|nr:Methionine aminopeptidase 1 [Coelomomyces lativittatus]